MHFTYDYIKAAEEMPEVMAIATAKTKACCRE